MTISLKQLTTFLWPTFLLCAVFSLHAGAPINVERAVELKVTAIGTRLALAQQIPAFSIDTRTGLELSPQDRVLAELPVLPKTITAKMAASISWIHITGYGWLLIPRAWSVVDGGVGADGSMVLVAQAKSGGAWLEYTDAGQCVGCAINAAHCFYPQAQSQAIEFEFELTHCEQAMQNSSAKRLPPLQYQARTSKAERVQTLRNYHDSDGIRYQQLTLHQPSLPNAGSNAEVDLKQGALGVFFRRIWVASD
jgi:hypothetical protein